MSKQYRHAAHDQTRRRLMLSMGALAVLAGCGGNTLPRTSAVIDRHIAVGAGVTLHVRDWPAAQGDHTSVIVLLSGLGGNAHAFDSLAPALARRQRVLAITRRGYGQSGKPLPSSDATYAPATLVADLLAVLDTLKVQRIVLAGHSIAGNEVTLFAGRHPQRVRGVVYLDTTFDYSQGAHWQGEQPPENPIFDEPGPELADLASMNASIAYAKRIHKQWWPAMDAYWRDTLEVLADGRVRPNTPPAVAAAMAAGARSLSPDYRALRAPALVVVAQPATLADMMPWITPQTDPRDVADARTWLRLYPQIHGQDCRRIVAALPGSTLLTINNAAHSDFFIEYETLVVQAIEAMRWEK
ncbi:alpha/beta fold hydrolase [Janthinobacterium agaricidamnosum]|uniref:Alpha/beta hydrolase fold family protein n=1 Tax=Janthinobacterium agaricidamnosum NBRC 102515 = DSM 9628 TaxID=1349767 RepID=W0V549_9BURK|nr:alpha/beta hydrolase [Janthinobacterium agaricidamnosum]CDG82996.1 alpha/beta hydrolase fold family protein [Janthinobacterium agaricidamnosum NBRC 102515 = DSM 9628]